MARWWALALVAAVLGMLTACSVAVQPSAPLSKAEPDDALSSASAPPPADPAPGFHFALASDGHYGEHGTKSKRNFADLVTAVNAVDAADPLDLLVLNGDVSHGTVSLARKAKAALSGLTVPYLVVPGNHDRLTSKQWKQVWGTPANQVRRFGDRSLILANSSDAAGHLRCADTSWLAGALRGESSQRQVLVVFHVTPKRWTRFGDNCPAVRSVIAGAGNVVAVFNGHDHEQLGRKTDAGADYFFDGHFGGSWGSKQKTLREVHLTGSGGSTQVRSLSGATLTSSPLR